MRMASLSLKSRANLINQEVELGSKRLTGSKLRSIYKSSKIKYKAVKIRKCWRRSTNAILREKDVQVLKDLQRDIDQAKWTGEEIIFADESCFN